MNAYNQQKMPKVNLGENILKWRKLKGLKQEDLASRVGISKTALSNIENNFSKPNIDRIADIANGLGIDLQMLLSNPEQIFVNNEEVKLKFESSNRENLKSNFDSALLEKLLTLMDAMTSYFFKRNEETYLEKQ